jgi:hypothetical protein
MIYSWPTRVSRVFQMVYWLTSAPRPIHHHPIPSFPLVVRRPTAHAAQPFPPPPIQKSPGPRAPASCRCPSAGPRAAWLQQQRQRRPARAACAPAAWPPRCARPASPTSTIDLRRWALFGHPLHAEVEEAPVPRRLVGLGQFRPFPNGLVAPKRVFCHLQINLTVGPKVIQLRSKFFWSPTVCTWACPVSSTPPSSTHHVRLPLLHRRRVVQRGGGPASGGPPSTVAVAAGRSHGGRLLGLLLAAVEGLEERVAQLLHARCAGVAVRWGGSKRERVAQLLHARHATRFRVSRVRGLWVLDTRQTLEP